VIDLVSSWALGAFAGGAVGFWIGRWWPLRDPFHRWWRRSPYSSAAIIMRATEEDAHKYANRIISPLAGEDPPPPQPIPLRDWLQQRRDPWADPRLGVPFTEGSTQRGNGSGGPSTPKPDIVPKGQFRRVYHYNPATIAECGGPCEEGGPAACDCGAITWTDRPQPPSAP
jgi:hypothetical protein